MPKLVDIIMVNGGYLAETLSLLHDSPKLNDVIIVNGGSLLRSEGTLSRNSYMLVTIPGGDVFQPSDLASPEKNHAFYFCFWHF